MHAVQTNEEGNEHRIHLVHYMQRESWDCGLACIMMVLSRQKRNFFLKHFDEICENEGFERSTWTIDLCYILKKFSIPFTFFTTVIGVNPDHCLEFFYKKILPQDEERVRERFCNAKEHGIDVIKKSLKTHELITHLKNHGPIILLTNAGYLSCKHCKKYDVPSEAIDCIPSSYFHGHFIVLCGYNLIDKHFYYRNPAFTNRICVMDFCEIDKARLSHGTDEDCIFIYNNNPEG